MAEDDKKPCCSLPDICADQCGSCTRYLCSCPPKSRVSYSTWANEQAFWGGLALLFTGILASSYSQTANTHLYIAGQYIKYINIPVAIFIIILEYPRGNKPTGGKIEQRPFQKYIAPIHYFFRWPTKCYLPRSIFYLSAAGIAQFNLATIMAGWCLFIASIFYFVASVYGEKWTPPTLAYGRDSIEENSPTVGGVMTAPKDPPPRLSEKTLADEKSQEVEIHENPNVNSSC